MHVAIEGCCHGELDAIYASLQRAEREKGVKVDLLLICGDFQALRNPHDFESLAVPHKFRNLGSFHSYYSGEKVAPMLTIVIGGNHEASNYMWELYHGGWLAPNIYYLGNAGSVLVNGLRISGASGIYKSHDYFKGFFETLPYDRSTLRSCYHIRHYSVTKLMLLPPSPTPSNLPAQESPSPFPPSTHPSIFLSHDWPLSIAPHGDLPGLLKRKPFFADEIRDNTLGSKPLLELLKVLQPKWWFAAHLHVKFAALWKHGESGQKRLESAPKKVEKVKNPDEIDLDDDDEEESAPAPPPVSNPDEISLNDDDEDVPPTSAVDAAADKAEVVETAELVQDAVETNPDEIMLDDDEDEEPAGHRHHPKEASASVNASTSLPPRPPQQVEIVQSGTSGEEGITRFLALDKCMPNKDFLQILELPFPVESEPNSPPSFTFDPHWLAITRALHPFLSLTPQQARMPSIGELKELVKKEMQWVHERGLGFDESGQGKVKVEQVQTFWKTAPCPGEPGGGPAAWYTNPQTVAFCDMLQIPNKINPFPEGFAAPPLPFPSLFSESVLPPALEDMPTVEAQGEEEVAPQEVEAASASEEGEVAPDGQAAEAGS